MAYIYKLTYLYISVEKLCTCKGQCESAVKYEATISRRDKRYAPTSEKNAFKVKDLGTRSKNSWTSTAF